MRRKTPRTRSAPTRPPRRLPPAAAPKPPHVEGPAEPSGRNEFPIVGIGASAGGLEAFSQLLRELPVDTGKFTDGLHQTTDWYFKSKDRTRVGADLERMLIER